MTRCCSGFWLEPRTQPRHDPVPAHMRLTLQAGVRPPLYGGREAAWKAHRTRDRVADCVCRRVTLSSHADRSSDPTETSVMTLRQSR